MEEYITTPPLLVVYIEGPTVIVKPPCGFVYQSLMEKLGEEGEEAVYLWLDYNFPGEPVVGSMCIFDVGLTPYTLLQLVKGLPSEGRTDFCMRHKVKKWRVA